MDSGESRKRTQELWREMTQLRRQRDFLHNLWLIEEINGDTFAAKGTEFSYRIVQLVLRMESVDRSSSEQADLAIRVFELSQVRVGKWLSVPLDRVTRH